MGQRMHRQAGDQEAVSPAGSCRRAGVRYLEPGAGETEDVTRQRHKRMMLLVERRDGGQGWLAGKTTRERAVAVGLRPGARPRQLADREDKWLKERTHLPDVVLRKEEVGEDSADVEQHYHEHEQVYRFES